MNRRRVRIATLLTGAFASLATTVTWATPQFARERGVTCTACHAVPPMLSEDGLAFQASGFLPPDTVRASASRPEDGTIPMAVWITSRYEDTGGTGPSDLFLPKLELISGGRVGDNWSYFVEWRLVSQGLRSDGTLSDRGGRFEDLFFEWQSDEGRHAFKLGQHRSVNQVDVSLRLSASEPLVFKNGVRTGTDPDPRVNGLETFSPSSRSPSIGYRFQSIRGETPSDGLFHFVTVPFVGEFSIPLSSEASSSASFELGGPKGLYAETFYRRGLRSVGGHAFVGGDGSWLVNVVGALDLGDFILTASVGVDGDDTRDQRERASLQAEYLAVRGTRFRGAAGLRIEEVSNDGSSVAYVPYLVVSLPTTRYTYLLQLQHRAQDGADSFVADLSLLF